MPKYVNLNPFPVTLPTPSGGQRVFRPGDFDTGSWFSRFQGHHQLTEVADDFSTPSPPTPVRQVPRPFYDEDLVTDQAFADGVVSAASLPFSPTTPPEKKEEFPRRKVPSFIDSTFCGWRVDGSGVVSKV